MKSPTGRYSYRQDVNPITTRHRVGDVFYMASRRGCMTSLKPLTRRITNRQAVKTNRQAGSMSISQFKDDRNISRASDRSNEAFFVFY